MIHRRSVQMFVSIFIGLLIASSLLFLLSTFVMAMPGAKETINPNASSMPVKTTSYYTVSLPIVLKPYGSLYGSVSENGEPAPGITVTLEFCTLYLYPPKGDPYCSHYDKQFSYTSTDDNGRYEFNDMPTLVITGPYSLTQTYQIWWKNGDENPDRLARWESRILDSYTQGDRVNLSNFDIDDIEILSPISGTVVTDFPLTFQWIPRAYVSTDSYALCLYGGIQNVTAWDRIGCDQPLGYVDNFTIANPFSGVDYGADYYWNVQVFDSNGGYGVSYETNWIGFMNP